MGTIAIADMHTLCREALCNYIRHADQDLSVSGFGDCKSLHDFIAGNTPDLILIDDDFPACEEGGFGDVRIGLMVTVPEEKTIMNPDLHGIFPKNLSCKSFLKGIHDILDGGTFFPSPEDGELKPPPIKRAPQDFGLTAREKEVLSYLVKGQSNKDIARALDLQVVTIKLHVRGICRKMKVSNRTQAALTAKENGWG